MKMFSRPSCKFEEDLKVYRNEAAKLLGGSRAERRVGEATEAWARREMNMKGFSLLHSRIHVI